MSDADSVELQVVAAWICYQSPSISRFRGLARAPVETDPGRWQIELLQALPPGEFTARFGNLTDTASVTWGLQELSPTVKDLHMEVAGVQGTINGFSLEFCRMLPPG
jgi:hypothetical protein